MPNSLSRVYTRDALAYSARGPVLVLGTVSCIFSKVLGIVETRDYSQAIHCFTGSRHYARPIVQLRLREDAASTIPKRE